MRERPEPAPRGERSRPSREERREERAARIAREAAEERPSPRREIEPREPIRGPRPVVYDNVLDPGLVDADAARVIRRLRENGFHAYLVGGGVRDILLGRRPKDFDIATDARPQDVKHVFRNCRIIGRRFRLAHILFADGKVIECATFRRDPDQELGQLPADISKHRGHRAEGAVRLVPLRSVTDEDDLLIRHDNHFGAPHEDAARRDFTINGLFYDPRHNEVIDYVGGMADLDRRVVRTIGEPAVRFREDPVRILRAIKFSARLDMGLSPEVYDAIVEHRGELAKASKPRLFEEILRLLRGGAAHRSMYLCWDLGVLSVVLPELAAFLDDDPQGAGRTWARLSAVDAAAARGELPTDAVLLAALFLDLFDEALTDENDPIEAFDDWFPAIVDRTGFPRRMKERIVGLWSVLPRLRAQKVGALAQRGGFDEARALYLLELDAEGKSPPAWALGQGEPPEDDDVPKKKRRRRKKKPGDAGA